MSADKTPAETMWDILGLSEKIGTLIQRSRCPGREWGYGRAATLQSLKTQRKALTGLLPPLQLVK